MNIPMETMHRATFYLGMVVLFGPMILVYTNYQQMISDNRAIELKIVPIEAESKIVIAELNVISHKIKNEPNVDSDLKKGKMN